jgi:hypothetical protein
MAKKRGVPGWHAMRKEQLVKALLKPAKSRRNGSSRSSSNGKSNGTKVVSKAASSKTRLRVSQLQDRLEKARNLAHAQQPGDREIKDRLIVMVRDPYWLHAYWELSRTSVARVQAAMGQYWHGAQPQLRLFETTRGDDAPPSNTLVRTIDIHGGVNNWYVDVQNPPKSYRMEIGYLAANGKFHTVCRSNAVKTPAAASRDLVDQNWTNVAENFDRIYAMSGGYSAEGTSGELQELLEERLRRPMGSPVVTRYGSGAGAALGQEDPFEFEANAEMIIYGTTQPDAHVTLKGEPVQVRGDGSFTVRMNMPDRRQVIPVVASAADGVEQRTIVIAIERNTKRMETVIRGSSDD